LQDATDFYQPLSATLDNTMSTSNRKVIESLHNQEADRCVDVFAHADGTFGYEEYRRDHEDGGRWHSLQRYSSLKFATADEARSQALSGVDWLDADR